MSAKIYYYTGTGNSLWVARTIAAALGDTEVIPIVSVKGIGQAAAAETVGIVFPVHIWGVPQAVLKFMHKLKVSSPAYLYAVAVNAGQVANTLVQLKRVMAGHGMKLSAGFDIVMPSNYIPWGGPGPDQERQRRYDCAREKIGRISGNIRSKQELPVEKGPLWQRIIFSNLLYKLAGPMVPVMDRQFRADDKCNQCGVCRRVCPAANITLVQGRPVWNHACEQCFACLQWCPQEAVQYGEKTVAYERYHHPEVALKDVLPGRE